MNRYAYQFIIKEIPDSVDSLSRLSDQLTEEFGAEGFQLIDVTALPQSNPPSLCFSFQKQMA